MRKMKHSNYGTVVNVEKVIITNNFWEYFITDEKFNEDIVCAVVRGFETEMGDVSLSEIKPYIMAQGKPQGCLPAPGWEWVD